MSDEIELADLACPKCGNDMARRDCNSCEDGYISMYEDDPFWYDEDDDERCDDCNGHGAHIWCQKCGWDHLNNRYLNGKSELIEERAT